LPTRDVRTRGETQPSPTSVGNRLVGILRGCRTLGTLYDEDTAGDTADHSLLATYCPRDVGNSRRPFFVVSSVVLAVVALGWMFERIFEEDLGISEIVDPLVKFPRVLVAVAAFTIGAAVLHEFERRRGRLVPLRPDEPLARGRRAASVLVP
jgi:hypothetical protein